MRSERSSLSLPPSRISQWALTRLRQGFHCDL
jgi:hypothetical protein